MDDVLSHDECGELVALHRGHAHAGYIHHLTITRFADLAGTAAAAAAHILPLARARDTCWQRVEEAFDAQLELYPEFTALMGWHKGAFLKKHYDANRDYLSDRHYSAILYLNGPAEPGCAANNDTFEGGDLNIG